MSLVVSDLDRFMTGGVPPGYSATSRTFYSPVDDVHGALLLVIQSAVHSICLAMYGFDDDELDSALHQKVADPDVFFMACLDKSQAGGAHERALLAKWQTNLSNGSISVGHSEKGAIQHMKVLICDGQWVVTGSTNWSTSGETKQDNQCTILCDAVEAARLRSRLDQLHANQLRQMGAAG